MPADHTPIPPIINGLRGSFKQPGSWGRSESGYFWNYKFEGTAAEVDSDAAALNANGAQFEVEELHGGLKRVTARLSWNFGEGAEVPEDVWELEPNEVEKDLLQADMPYGTIYGAAGVGTINFRTKDAIVQVVEAKEIAKWTDSSQAVAGGVSYLFDNGVAADTATTIHLLTVDYAAAKTLYYLMRSGVTSFPIEASTIRHTRTVSNTYAVKASFTNVGRVLSTAQLTSLESAPEILLWDLPTIPTAVQFIQAVNDLQYGWRKIRPRITRQNYNKWQITNVYQFGLWSVRMFGAYPS